MARPYTKDNPCSWRDFVQVSLKSDEDERRILDDQVEGISPGNFTAGENPLERLLLASAASKF